LFSNDNQTWGDNYFYTPFGENTSLFCSAHHFYDDEPFSGTAALFDWDNGSIYNVTFYDGFGLWTGNRGDVLEQFFFNSQPLLRMFNMVLHKYMEHQK